MRLPLSVNFPSSSKSHFAYLHITINLSAISMRYLSFMISSGLLARVLLCSKDSAANCQKFLEGCIEIYPEGIKFVLVSLIDVPVILTGA